MESNRQRDRKVSLWLSEEELGTIRSAASLTGLSVTEFVVERCVRNTTTFSLKRVPGAPEDAEVPPRRSRRSAGAKSERICLRCTIEEKEAIAAKAARSQVAISDLMVASALDKEVSVIQWDEDGILKRTYDELRRQGTNLNQMALAMNRIRAVSYSGMEGAASIERLANEVVNRNEETRGLINDALGSVIFALAKIARSHKLR